MVSLGCITAAHQLRATRPPAQMNVLYRVAVTRRRTGAGAISARQLHARVRPRVRAHWANQPRAESDQGLPVGT